MQLSEPDNTPRTCSQCHHPLSPNMKFCENCGKPVGGPAPEPESLARPAGGMTPEPAAAEIAPVPEPVPVAPASPATKSPVQKPATPLPAASKPATAGTGSSQKTLIIAGIVGLLILATLSWFVLIPMLSVPVASNAGTGPALSGTAGTPTTTAPAATTQGAAAVSFEPKSTQVLPVNLEVTYQADRDPITGLVTVTFTGGPGLNGISETSITLTRSDGQVVTKSFKPKQVGDFVTLQGTLKTDRIEVIANFYNGDSFRVIDKLFEYKKKN